MAHRSEQANVLGFVLVGALLVALLLGGIYVVRHNIAGQAGNNVAGNDQSETTTTDADKAQNGSTSPDTSGDGQSDQALEDALNEQSTSNEQQNSGNTADSSSSSSTPQTQVLPDTGPADTLAAMLGATLLAGAGFSYTRSRRLI